MDMRTSTARIVRRAAASAIALAVVAVAVASAQDKAPILHEDLPAPGGPDPSPLVGDDPVAGKNPDAFAAGDKMLAEPEMSKRTAGEPVFGRDGFATDRMTEERPDYSTGSDGTLHYVSVFNPDVMPFKRMSSLDGVASDYRAILRDQATRDLPVGGATDHTRDRFWGSLVVELAPGKQVAIPSVAPDMRILSYETQPAVTLTFSKDAADNFYVRSDDRGVRGQVRLVFLADASAGYFAPALPTRTYTVARVRALAQRDGLLPTLPPEIQRAGERGLALLKIQPDDLLDEAFNKLVRYHRAFEAKEIKNPTGDIYWDLFENQAGVCRHRSSTFQVTALAAGIPTRLVTNEAHAFVEVWFPDRGWQRIDLGGAAMRMEVSGAEDKAIHRPRAEDPFDKPKQYTENYTKLEGDIRGLSASQLEDGHKKPGDAPASGDFGTLTDDGTGGNGNGNAAIDDVVGPGSDLGTRKIDPRKLTPTITITLASDTGYRGEPVHVEGRVDGPRGPVAGVRVDVLLAPAHHGGSDAIVVGRGATASDGTFTADAVLPIELELADYELYVTTREDARYNGASSD